MSNGFTFFGSGVHLGSLASDPSGGKPGDMYFNTTFNKDRFFNGTSWQNIGTGSGGGDGGINIVGLDTSYLPNNTDDIDAEGTVGNWLAYADAAGIQPVDMTGGSPTVTITRTTTGGEVLDGTGSFKVTKTASNLQGNGASLLVNVPLAYRGKRHSLFNPWKVISGNINQGDVLFYFYDVTNSQLLNPVGFDLVQSYFQLNFFIDIPSNTTQIRMGYHFASTSASALTFTFDDNFLGVGKNLTGPSILDQENLSSVFTFNGVGTPTSVSVWGQRVGDSLVVYGKSLSGTPTGVPFTLNLPNGWTIDANKITSSSNSLRVGYLERNNGTGSFPSSGSGPYPVFFDGSTLDKLFICTSSASSLYSAQNGNGVVASGDNFSFQFTVPILGWSANTAIAPSGVIRLSDIVANGTRVTTIPTKRGEYRCLIKNNAASTLSDDSPASPPNSSDGMRIYSTSGTGPGTSGQTNVWYFYVGKALPDPDVHFYANAARTGKITPDYYFDGSSEKGINTHYDDAAGILAVFLPIGNGSASRYVGFSYSSETSAPSLATDCYFDAFIADNNFQIQLSSDVNKPVYLRESVSSGTSGATPSGTTWDDRALNTVEGPQLWIDTSALPLFTLQPGYYDAEGWGSGVNITNHKMRLFNNTDSTDAIVGQSGGSFTTSAGNTVSLGGSFYITSPKTFKLQSRASGATSNGYGNASSFGNNEVYSQLKITKLS